MYNYQTPDYKTKLAPGMLGAGAPSSGGSGGFDLSSLFGGQGQGDLMGGLSSLLGGLGMLSGGAGKFTNPAEGAMGYLNQVPGMMGGYMNPFIQAGQGAMGSLQGQYANLLKLLPQLQGGYGQMAGIMPQAQQQYSELMADPGAVMNKLGQGFQASPGYNFARDQALGASQRAANAGGMAGTAANQYNQQGVANQMANQEYGNYMNRAMNMYGQGLQGGERIGGQGLQGLGNLYGQGLQGQQGMMHQGYDASKSMAENLANILQSQAQLSYAGQNAENLHSGAQAGQKAGGLGMLGGALGQLLPLLSQMKWG